MRKRDKATTQWLRDQRKRKQDETGKHYRRGSKR